MHWVNLVLRGVRLLGKVPIRLTSKRRVSLLQVSQQGVLSSSLELVDRLARKIFNMEKEKRDELKSVCQRIGIGNKIDIKKFINNGSENDEYVSSISLDDVNIGLLSDGTLRVLSILIEIMTSNPSATTIIEEPETQVHPGMLEKLLNELEAYTFEENLILSTHSPQVVSWTNPDKINLVYREHGQTFVRKLGEDEIQKVVKYLSEEGDLGDWIYSGILDE